MLSDHGVPSPSPSWDERREGGGRGGKILRGEINRGSFSLSLLSSHVVHGRCRDDDAVTDLTQCICVCVWVCVCVQYSKISISIYIAHRGT